MELAVSSQGLLEMSKQLIANMLLAQVDYTEEPGRLYYFKYPLADDSSGQYLPVATTRPETILGDTAVAVHPEDERFRHFIGLECKVPLCNGRCVDTKGFVLPPSWYNSVLLNACAIGRVWPSM